MFLSDLSIRRPVFTTMVIAAIIVFGAVAYTRIGLDMMPNVEFPFATIFTIYPGAGPETVEKEVTEKIENAVSTINGVHSLRSISVENVSQVIVEFELEIKADQAIQDVRDKVSGILPFLPSNVKTPKIQKLDLGSIPIISVAVGGPGSIDEVTKFARKRVKEPIQSIRGVGTVDIVGGQEREIKVWIDPERLNVKGLAITDVLNALAANNLSFPGGRLDAGSTEFTVKVDGEFKSIPEIEQLKIMEVMGHAIRLKDVARVEDGLEERRSMARLNGKSAVVLVVRKQSGTNAVAVGDRIKEKIKELKKDFPKGFNAFLARDNTSFTRTAIEHVQFDMMFGAFLAVLIVFLFLRNVRSTIIAALAIPTSVIGTFIFINIMGFTFNTLTMLALSLSIGLLIDDAIVVIENIYRHMEQGASPIQASRSGAAEIGLAVLATTMSIIAVFIPVAFTQGIIGRMFYEFGLTVAVAVIISLFVSFSLTPMLSSRFLTPSGENFLYRGIEKVLVWLDMSYRTMISWALAHRIVTVVVALVVFAGSLYLAGLIPGSFIPTMDMSQLNVVVTTPTGTNLSRTDSIAENIASRIRAHKDAVAGTVLTIGADPQKKQNLAKIYVKMKPKDQRRISQMEFMDQIRKELQNTSNSTVAIEQVPLFGGDTGMRAAKIQFNIRGGNLEQLDKVSRNLLEALKNEVPGLVDLDTTYEAGKPEVYVRVDKDRAATMGVVTAMIGQVVNAMVGGVEISKYRDKQGDDVPIRVRLEPSARQRAEQISMLKVRSPMSPKTVSLANMVKVEPGTGPTQIDRQARQRQITILGNLEKGVALGPTMDKIRRVAKKVVPQGLQTDFEGQAKIAQESMGYMMFSLMLAVIMIYMVLASQFESFIHPLTIMMSLPLSIAGAIGALLLANEFLSMMAMIGVIMLMGLVTKNAILLIDYTNTLRNRDGMKRTDALLKAGPTRLRPILMTTAAMVFGMLPIALSNGQGSEMRSPMAVAVIGGLILSTVLTLVVVPVVYSLLDDLSGFVSGKRSTQ